MPGVGSLDHPSFPGLEGLALLADDIVAPQGVQEVAGLLRVVTSVEVDRDLVGEVEPEAGHLLQCFFQEW